MDGLRNSPYTIFSHFYVCISLIIEYRVIRIVSSRGFPNWFYFGWNRPKSGWTRHKVDSISNRWTWPIWTSFCVEIFFPMPTRSGNMLWQVGATLMSIQCEILKGNYLSRDISNGGLKSFTSCMNFITK